MEKRGYAITCVAKAAPILLGKYRKRNRVEREREKERDKKGENTKGRKYCSNVGLKKVTCMFST